MTILFKTFLIIHILGGSVGLITGLLNIIQNKGGVKHKLIGKVFYFSMLSAGLTSLVLACIHPNYFLFMVGLFTLYMVLSGYRYLKIKHRDTHVSKNSDWAITIIMFLAGIIFIVLGIWFIINLKLFGLVFTTFGCIGLLFVRQDYLNFTNKATTKNYWLLGHLQRMTGAFIASLTAFLVVNTKYFPDTIPSYIFWLLPTTLFTPLIIKWSKKHELQKVKNLKSEK